MSEEGARLVRRIFEHTYNARTYDALSDLYHPDLVYHAREEDPEPGEYRGRDAFLRLIAGYVEALTEITFELSEVIDAGDYTIAVTTLKGSGSASGVEIEDPYVFVYEVRDGLVVTGWEFRARDEALALVAGRRG